MFGGSKPVLLSYQILPLFVSVSLHEKCNVKGFVNARYEELPEKGTDSSWLLNDNFYQKSFGYKDNTLWQF
jgi:hypothetical protein